MVLQGIAWEGGVERQHMNGARVYKGDRTEDIRDDREMPQDARWE